jgi:hypothetical protein
MDTEIKNGKITSTMLGFEDHGILTASITIDFGHSRQGFGGYSLGETYTDQWVRGVIKAVGVQSWEELVGTFVRVKTKDRLITSIGHIIEDSWFLPPT